VLVDATTRANRESCSVEANRNGYFYRARPHQRKIPRRLSIRGKLNWAKGIDGQGVRSAPACSPLRKGRVPAQGSAALPTGTHLLITLDSSFLFPGGKRTAHLYFLKPQNSPKERRIIHGRPHSPAINGQKILLAHNLEIDNPSGESPGGFWTFFRETMTTRVAYSFWR